MDNRVSVKIEDAQFVRVLTKKIQESHNVDGTDVMQTLIDSGTDGIKQRWFLTDEELSAARKRANFITKNKTA